MKIEIPIFKWFAYIIDSIRAFLAYPLAAIECRISGTPNHPIGRREFMDTRTVAAIWDNLGPELNFDRMEQEEIALLKEEN